jgi:hypothetical protein
LHGSHAQSALLSPFSPLRNDRRRLNYTLQKLGREQDGETAAPWGRRVNRKIMDDGIQKSCWGVTAKAVVGFAGILLLAWLIGGPETAAVLAAS